MKLSNKVAELFIQPKTRAWVPLYLKLRFRGGAVLFLISTPKCHRHSGGASLEDSGDDHHCSPHYYAAPPDAYAWDEENHHPRSYVRHGDGDRTPVSSPRVRANSGRAFLATPR